MIENWEEAAQNAEARTRNIPNTCQIVTRDYFGAPSVGDFDGDGAADAEDGWKREPDWAKHPGDRNPPRGHPVSWLRGSRDNGHRAISLGGGMIRSTDAPSSGITSTVPLRWVEDNWGLEYAGWSETISGLVIPDPPAPEPVKRQTQLNKARAKLKLALEDAVKKGYMRRARLIREALESLPRR